MRRPRIVVLFGLACLFAVAANAAPPVAPGNEKYALQTVPFKKIQAVLTYEVTAPGLVAKEWILFAAKPPELLGQREVSVEMAPAAVPVTDRAKENEAPLPGRTLLMARVPAGDAASKKGFKARIEYKASMYGRRLVPRDREVRYDPVPPVEAKERKAALASTKAIDHESAEFQAWLDANKLRRKPREGEIDYARRMFLTIKRSFAYAYPPPVDRTASLTCGAKKSDCGGLSIVFCAALRAHAIPARMLVGRWTLSAEKGQELGGVGYYQWHAKAEFHAAGVGWVPADCSSAVLHDKVPDGLTYFGNDPGDFLTMHFDSDLEVDTIHFGRQALPSLQGVAFWVTGTGNLDGLQTREDWQVE